MGYLKQEYLHLNPLIFQNLKCHTLSEYNICSAPDFSSKKKINFPRDEIVSLDIDVGNIVVTNLSTFTIKEANISLENLSLWVELTVASLRVRERIKDEGRVVLILNLGRRSL